MKKNKRSTAAKRSLAAHKANWTRSVRKAFPEGGPMLAPEIKLVPKSGAVVQNAQLAFAACRSICFATENAVRHGGDYSLNDLLAADKLAREALGKKGGAS